MVGKFAEAFERLKDKYAAVGATGYLHFGLGVEDDACKTKLLCACNLHSSMTAYCKPPPPKPKVAAEGLPTLF